MPINQVEPPQAHEMLKSNPDAIYLDVRTEGEFAQGHPAGAINIPVVFIKGPGQMQLNRRLRRRGGQDAAAREEAGRRMHGGRTFAARVRDARRGRLHRSDQRASAALAAQRDASGKVVVAGWRDAGLPVTTDLGDNSYQALRARPALAPGAERDKAASLMAIRLTRIYTRTGDKGQTALVGGKRVPKESARLEAYGTIDELNSIIGIVRTYLPLRDGFGADFDPYSEILRRIQNELFDVGSELATPPDGEYPQMHKMGAGEIKKLEDEMDAMEKELEPLKSFTLPGGGVLNAFLHQARTVCRRAERVCWVLKREEDYQRQSHHLRESPERPSVRAIAMGREAARRARVSVGPRAANRRGREERRAAAKSGSRGRERSEILRPGESRDG